MRPDRSTRLFLRDRSRGDAAALGRVFDDTAPALMQLALRLAARTADAEGLVQSTRLTSTRARAHVRRIAAAAALANRRPDASCAERTAPRPRAAGGRRGARRPCGSRASRPAGRDAARGHPGGARPALALPRGLAAQ